MRKEFSWWAIFIEKRRLGGDFSVGRGTDFWGKNLLRRQNCGKINSRL